MSTDGLKLTTYFGERDRVEHEFLADALFAIYQRHGLRASVLMRGVEGFGARHHRRTDRLLSLSEDLPIVSVAVDRIARIEAALRDVEELEPPGLVTLERARLLDAGGVVGLGGPEATGKLTLYFGRGARAGGGPAHRVAVDLLHERHVEGGTVLVGVDGTLHGERQRARFFSGNADVPLMLISVGSAGSLEVLVHELRAMLDNPVMTLERVQVLKRDGRRLEELRQVPATDPSGLAVWQKLMLYAAEQTHFNGRPVHIEAVRRLREAGAAGVTTLRGVWGYHGAHAPHGDSFWSLRRRVPTLTVVVDTPVETRKWLAILDEITPERGMITSEIVPAYRSVAANERRGGLRLAAGQNAAMAIAAIT
jgi:PII-like signaling protein